MKTLKQIADEIGISNQAVYMKIKRNSEFANALNGHMIDENGVNMVDDEGEQLIKSTIKRRKADYRRVTPVTGNVTPVTGDVTPVTGNVNGNITSSYSNILGVTDDVTAVTAAIVALKTDNVRLAAENKALEQRLSDKDRQIEELRQLLSEQTRERQAYSAALITANTKLSEIRHLTLTDRLFGWGNVQAMLTDSSAADRNEKPTNIVDVDIKE